MNVKSKAEGNSSKKVNFGDGGAIITHYQALKNREELTKADIANLKELCKHFDMHLSYDSQNRPKEIIARRAVSEKEQAYEELKNVLNSLHDSYICTLIDTLTL